jgi:hypothetical protein
VIDVQFTVTESEYLEAQHLFMREQQRKSRWWRWGVWLVLLVSTADTLVTTSRPIPPYTFVCVIFCFFPLWNGLLRKMAFRKRFAKEKQSLTNAHVVVGHEGYRCDVPGMGSGITEWGAISGWLEGKTVFVLRSGYLMRIVPKSPLTEEQIESVRLLFAQEIGPAR